MKEILKFLTLGMVALTLVACAGKKHYDMNALSDQNEIKQQDAYVDEGHFMGLSASRQNQDLAKMVATGNNINVQEFQKLKVLGQENITISMDTNKITRDNLKVSKEDLDKDITLLALFEDMSKRQGTGEITLFFRTNSYAIPENTSNYNRLVNFVDYLSQNSKGRKVLLLAVGSASTTGKESTNMVLSDKRANSAVGILDYHLINIPHEFYKIYGLGGVAEGHRYQSVRIIAVYEPSQFPKTP